MSELHKEEHSWLSACIRMAFVVAFLAVSIGVILRVWFVVERAGSIEKEGQGVVLNIYATSFFSIPLSIVADRYSLEKQRKVTLLMDAAEKDLRRQKRGCYITVAKRPNIFLQKNISEQDYLSIAIKIAVVVSASKATPPLYSVDELIDFMRKNNMKTFVNHGSADAKEVVLEWYKNHITQTVCKTIAGKTAPMENLASDIGHRQVIMTRSKYRYIGKYVVYVAGAKLVSNIDVQHGDWLEYLYRDVDLIFVERENAKAVRDRLYDECVSSYMNNDFALTLRDTEMKDFSSLSIGPNEAVVGFATDTVIGAGKPTYISDNNDNIVFWLVANGEDKGRCHDFFEFVKQNAGTLNKYGFMVG